MTYVCDFLNVDYGWLPIGYTNTEPFRGFYNGGGHTVSNLRLDRPKMLIGGLFGCLYGAKIDSLTILNADIQVEAVAGAIAGTAIVAGSDNQAGGPVVSSQVSNCTVLNSRIKSSAVAGGLVGMVDVYSRLLVDNCEVGGNNTLTSQYGAGGAVGLGVFKSYLVLKNVDNAVSVRTTMGAAGGLVGSSDTLLVVGCNNTGDITVQKDEEERFGAGGIAGGTGCGQFVNCTNTGNVTGDRGVGGILGSALVDKGGGTEEDPGLYNSALFMTCINHAQVRANSYGGGICGEAQVTAISCGNFGQVNVAGGYAAGIVGNSPAVGLFNCMNKGAVSAARMSGGMNGLAIFGTAAFCDNYGHISSIKGYTGGIMGLGGGGAMIHYCGNYGNINAVNGDGPVGGIVGELGKVRKWEAADIVSVIMGSVGIISSAASMATSSAFASRERAAGEVGNLTDMIDKINFNKQVRVADITFKALDISQGVVNTIMAGFNIAARIDPASPWIEVEKATMQKAVESRSIAIRDSLESVRKAMTVNFASIPLIDTKQTVADQRYYLEYEQRRLDHKVLMENLNRELDLRRSNLQEIAEEDKARRDQVFDILNAVISAVSLVIFIASIPLTGGASGVALGIVGSVLGMISGASTISQSVMNYQVNATEVTQCFNYGQVSGGDNCGGIAGHLNDYGHVYDCYNAGTILRASSNTGLIAGKVGNQIVLANTLDISDSSDGFSIVGHALENPKRIASNYRATSDELSHMIKADYYKGWDFWTSWRAPSIITMDESYCLPIIHESMYAKY